MNPATQHRSCIPERVTDLHHGLSSFDPRIGEPELHEMVGCWAVCICQSRSSQRSSGHSFPVRPIQVVFFWGVGLRTTVAFVQNSHAARWMQASDSRSHSNGKA